MAVCEVILTAVRAALSYEAEHNEGNCVSALSHILDLSEDGCFSLSRGAHRAVHCCPLDIQHERSS